eukprot:4401412-Prorocentrum_lima.AAC.1
MGDPESEGGPPLSTVLRRLTLDLHTREIIGDVEVVNHTSKDVLDGEVACCPWGRVCLHLPHVNQPTFLEPK